MGVLMERSAPDNQKAGQVNTYDSKDVNLATQLRTWIARVEISPPCM